MMMMIIIRIKIRIEEWKLKINKSKKIIIKRKRISFFRIIMLMTSNNYRMVII